MALHIICSQVNNDKFCRCPVEVIWTILRRECVGAVKNLG